tara:strand:+ start:2482 stop:3759 length:1278 start_codon:yes stop_codon:yes gene_type:complete
MARNRVIYQSEALFAGQKSTASTITAAHTTEEIRQLHRVQSANYSFNIARTDVNQFGELAAIDRVALETPTVSLDFTYLLANLSNEEHMGFKVNDYQIQNQNLVSALDGMLKKTEDERNFFIQTSTEGEDAIGDTSRDGDGTHASVIGIGNGFITSYSTEASVGGFPTCSVSVEAMNMNFNTGTQDIPNPAINRTNGNAASSNISLPAVSGSASFDTADDNNMVEAALNISTLRPGDIKIMIAEHQSNGQFGTTHYDAGMPGAKLPEDNGTSTNSANIQSYTINFDMGRTAIQRLGNRFAFAREIDFPVSVNLSFDAILTDLTTGNLNQLIDCEKSYDIRIQLQGITGSCGQAKGFIAEYYMKDMKPDAQSYSSSIGDNKTVTLDFTTQIGGPRQTDVGLFMRGSTQSLTGDGTYNAMAGFRGNS